MENNPQVNGAKKPNMKMLLIILAAIIVLVLVVMVINSRRDEKPSSQLENNSPAAQQGENNIIPGEEAPIIETIVTDAGQIIPEGSRVEVVGANPIIDNIVVTQTGQVAKNDVVPMSPEAPQQTAPISKEQLPNSAVKLDVSASGFSPNSFEVKAGAPVTLSVSSVDGITHVFMFDDASLAAVAIGIGPNETRAITFNAPKEKGEYSFRCDVPGHAARGETGVMIVK